MAKKTIEQARAELLILRETYRRLFKTADGQVVLEDLVAKAEDGKGLRPAEGTPLDPYQAVYNEGARFSVRRVEKMLEGSEE